MAKAIGPIIQAVGMYIGGYLGAALVIIGGAVSANQARAEANRRARSAYNNSLQDRQNVVRSAVEARRFVLGRARVGGVIAYAATVGDRDEKLDQVVLVCDGPIKGIAGMWLNDVFHPASGFTSGMPNNGQFSPASRRAFTSNFRFDLDNSATFTLPHAPRSAADVHVSTFGAGDWGSLTVASVSGNVVTLTEPFTGSIFGDYQWLMETGPYQVQWHLGARNQAASEWPTVATPAWTSAHRLHGIAFFRSICDWDENAFSQGKPFESVLVDGVVVHDRRFNLNPVMGLEGAVAGAPGTLPDGVGMTGVSNGLSREVIGWGSEDGIPYFDLRLYGLTTASGVVQVRLPAFASCPGAAAGQAWSARAHLRVVAGAHTQFTALSLALMSWNSAGTGSVEATAAYGAGQLTGPMRDAVVTVSDAAVIAGTVRVGCALRLNYASGTTVDTTLRVGLPQLWRDADDPVRWTSNPAILAGWWMTHPRREGGMGIPYDWIDWDSVTAAANICDEEISVKKLDGTGYENVKRYECHTVLSTEASPGDNLQTIISAMAGMRAFTAGKYRLWAGAHRVPTMTITDADVVQGAPLRITPASGAADAPPNVMNGRIVDAAKGYVESGVTPVANPTYIAEDGGEEPLEVELPASTDARQAQYLLGVELEQQRPRLAAELSVTATKGADIGIGRSLVLDLTGYEDFDSLTWEVYGRVNRFDGTYVLKLRQTKANGWALNPDDFLPVVQPPRPDTDYLWDVAELVAFAAAIVSPTKLPDGSVVLRIACSWALHSQGYVRTSGHIEVRWRRVDTDAWSGPITVAGDATSATIEVGGEANARYVVQARAVNGLPAYSEWVQDLADSTPDTDIDGIDLLLSARAIVLPADTSGNVTSFSAALTEVSVWRNGVDETASWALSRTNSAGVGSSLSGTTLSITSMSAATDAGYVDVTATRSGHPTQTARLSLGKARAGADGSSAFTATATANMSWSGGVAEKISGTAAWDGSVRSDQAYPGGAGCAWVADTSDKGVMIGLNGDPATDAGIGTLDYAIHLTGTATLNIYEAGSSAGAFGSYAVGDVFAVIYNGDSVTYYRNGAVLRTVAAPAGLLMYLDSSFFHVGGKVSNLTFYPQAARGSDAKLLQLSATSQVFQVSKAGIASPSSITFNANAQNLDGAPTFSVIAGTASLSGSGTSRTLDFASLGSDVATIQVTQDGLTDTITVAKIREGGDAVVSLLSNEAIVLPATSAGVVTSYSGAVSSMSVFRGAVDDTANWTFSRTNGTGVTSTLAGNVLTVTNLADGTDASYVDVVATRSGYPTQTKRITLTKAKAGADGNDGDDGADAPLLTLSATSQIFTFDSENAASPTAQTISFTAVLANLAGTASFTCTRFDSTGANLGTVTLGGAGTNTRTLTVAQFGAAAYANITAALSGRSDVVTVVRVRDGASAVVSDLTNDSHTLPADAGGNVTSYTGANTRMVIYLGLTDDSSNWSYSASASTGITAALGTGSNKNLLTVTGMTVAVESGYVDITATRSGFPAQTKRFTLAKSKSAPNTSGPTQTWFAGALGIDLTSPYSMSATVSLKTDGRIDRATSPNASPGYTSVGWYTKVLAGIGGQYKARATLLDGVAPTSGALETWRPMSSDVSWSLSGSANQNSRLAIVIADASTDEVVGSGTISLGNASGA